ncbi:hypothetical protein, partial [Escherichia coli]|uniref:hypothetical protein n=1 Tax=Escherichia coli TaxID=562 RepID=UPI0032E3F956
EEQAGDSDAGERGGTVEQAPLSPLRAGLVRLALAGEVQGGRLHVLPCADEKKKPAEFGKNRTLRFSGHP